MTWDKFTPVPEHLSPLYLTIETPPNVKLMALLYAQRVFGRLDGGEPKHYFIGLDAETCAIVWVELNTRVQLYTEQQVSVHLVAPLRSVSPFPTVHPTVHAFETIRANLARFEKVGETLNNLVRVLEAGRINFTGKALEKVEGEG